MLIKKRGGSTADFICGSTCNMISRIINNVEIEIDETTPDELYFDEDFINSIEDFDGDISSIKDAMYNVQKKYLPLSITIELTNKCNFSCPFCYINDDLSNINSFKGIEYYKKIIDDLIDLGMLFCTLTGGECLLHPKFYEIYKYLKDKGVVVSVFTNGYLINKEVLELFRKLPPYKVEISIYGITEESFKASTNSKFDYKKVLDNILLLKKIGVNVICKTPITSLTSKDIPFIEQWCKKENIDYYVSDELFDSYNGRSVDAFRTFDSIYQNSVNNKRDFYIKNSNYVYGIKKAWECSAAKYSGVVSADGFFCPCMSCAGVKKYKFSLERGIKTAISNFKNVLNEEKGRKLLFCKGCKMFDVCEKCILNELTDSEDDIKRNCSFYKSLIEEKEL